jgi:hypothetical protein
MAQVCPIAFRTIDGTVARLNALSVSLLLLAYAATHEVILLLILGSDFLIRVYGKKIFSPIFQISTIIKKIFHMDTLMVDAGAKRVAAQMGIFFIFLLLVTSYFELYIAANIIVAIFLLCTAMEFFFKFCVGCEIYFLWTKLQ